MKGVCNRKRDLVTFAISVWIYSIVFTLSRHLCSPVANKAGTIKQEEIKAGVLSSQKETLIKTVLNKSTSSHIFDFCFHRPSLTFLCLVDHMDHS